MIWDSKHWKAYLLQTAKLIAKWKHQKRWPDASLFKLEKEVFIGFYAIRKLLDAKTKISFEARDTQTAVRVYNAKSSKPNLMNWHKLEDYYDLSNSKLQQMSLYDLCNSIVHSYVFIPSFDNSGLRSIFFNTDRERGISLIELDATRLQSIFERIGNDHIVWSESELDDDDEEWRVINASRKPRKRKLGPGKLET